MDREQMYKFAAEMLTYFGFASKINEVMEVQAAEWQNLLKDSMLSTDETLACKYRDLFYTKKVSGPYQVITEFGRFILNNPRIREEHFEERQAYLSKQECDACENQGVVMIPMENKSGQTNMRAFRCSCEFGKIRYGGLPEATHEMLRWRVGENRRETDKAREYIKGIGLDPDKPVSFREFFNHITKRSGQIGKNVSAAKKDNFTPPVRVSDEEVVASW